VLKLTIVFSLVVVTQRLDDEPVSADRPLLDAGDAHPLARFRVRAGPGNCAEMGPALRGGTVPLPLLQAPL